MSNKVWILTKEYNQYDQYGEYYIAAFANKPTPEQLIKLGINEYLTPHVLNGGGRKKYDEEWYNLEEKELL